MKKFLLTFVICVSSFMIYTNNVKASSYDWTNIYNNTNISCAGSTCSSITRVDNLSTFNVTTTNANFRTTIGFNAGVIRNNASALVFPFSVVNSSSGGNITCSGVTSNTMYLPQSGITTYNDGTTSNTSYIYGSGGTAGIYDTYYCNDFTYRNDSFGIVAESVVINPNNSDLNITLPCMIYGNGSDLYAYCPIDSARQNTNYRVDSINLYFTQNSTNNEVYRIKYYSNRLLFEIDNTKQIIDSINSNSSSINSKLEDIKSKLDSNNNTQQQISNNTNEIKNDIKSDNTSGAESSADDLKNNSAFQDNTGLSGVISMPLTFVNSLTNTCQPINLNIPYMDVDVTIPCMQSIITDKMPLLANLIKIIVNGFIVYRILLDIFQIVRNAKNPEDDRIEVLDL